PPGSLPAGPGAGGPSGGAPGAGGPSGGAPGAAPSAPTVSALSLEAAGLEAARRALQGGDAARALALLDQLQREFPQGQMGPEALMMRLDAMVSRGDRAGAAAIARRRLAAQPNGPYAARLRALAGGGAP
ncbi:MAG TPA: hypothetical protein VFS00_09030, partial [Polyangiaceae bacterium]|nr:hypothetical protein [Polyangiaceae bacterium]